MLLLNQPIHTQNRLLFQIKDYTKNIHNTSHRAFETLAAAANNAAPEGNKTANNDCNSTVLTNGNSSIAAALAAAHNPPSAISQQFSFNKII
jgi:hypothetical protein